MFGTFTGLQGNLFDDLSRLQRELDEAFGRWPPQAAELRSPAFGSWPPINIGATPERVDIYLFAPGLEPNELDISIQQNLLSIAGQRRIERGDDTGWYRAERFSGEFRRALTLPEDVDPERVDASYRDGILHVVVDRRESAQPKRISVS
jgi:HSP20 family protein